MLVRAKFFRIVLLVVVLATLAITISANNHGFCEPPREFSSGTQAEAGRKLLTLCQSSNAPYITSETIDGFERLYPDIEVQVSYLSSSVEYQYNQYKADFFSKKNSADIVCIETTWIPEFASQGWLLPLDNFFGASFKEQFIPLAVKSCEYAGTLYAVPGIVDIPVLYYRSDLVKQPPETYEQMIAMSGSLAKENGLKYGYVCPAQIGEGLSCAGYEFVWASGGELVHDGTVTAGTSEVRDGLRLFKDAIHSNSSTTDLFSFTEEDAKIAFQQCDALFMRNRQSVYKDLKDSPSPVRGKFATCELPRGANGESGSGTLTGWHYAISRGSKLPDESALFISYIVSEETQRYNCEQFGAPPTLLNCYRDAELVANFTDQDDPILNYEKARLRPATPYYMQISKQLAPEISKTIRGVSSPEDAAKRFEQILKRYFVLL